MVVHYTLQGHGCTSEGRQEAEASGSRAEQACESNNKISSSWWAAQVASNKEYDTKRELISTCKLAEEDVLVPRRMIYDVKDDKVDKKTEMVLPGYILLRLGNYKALKGLAMLTNYLSIIGRVSPDEMEIVKEYENIPKETDAHIGVKIIVTRGAFAGVKGFILEELEGCFSKCKLVFQGNEIITDMDRRIIERIS